ncbi:MAG: hypothetical protein PUG00_02130 [Clostridiales bacterium]|nr:hypothetical protein [Clostridiales bacterium]
MAKRIKRYLEYVDGILNRDDVDFAREAEKHLVQIGFFMHERLIHLLVLVLFAILTVITCIAFVVTANISLLILALAFMVLLVPYIMHYHLLENSVQYMYEQYDRMMEKTGEGVFVNR